VAFGLIGNIDGLEGVAVLGPESPLWRRRVLPCAPGSLGAERGFIAGGEGGLGKEEKGA
jgi:hypothetical protein